MATTQNLTKLPTIQYTGMDYSTIISQIKEIIESNSNWASNWTEFYNSEAGTMLIQLMAWICDNLGVRQDLLYNEMFLSTATSDSARIRLLNQIGYIPQTASAAITSISIEFNKVITEDINLSNCRDDDTKLDDIKNNIFKFYGSDINGKSCSYEILSVSPDGVPDYTKSIKLNSGGIYYTTDSDGNDLKAIQGNTVYSEFTSDTDDGPYFDIENENIDLKTLVVYDITNNINIKHKRVDNFIDTSVLNGNIPCYVVEKTDDGYFRIRYPSENLVTYNNSKIDTNLFPAGHTIGVFYRTSNGSDGNIPADYLNVSDSVYGINGNRYDVTIKNISSGYMGKDEETLSDATLNAPTTISTMNRAVTVLDYDNILKNNDLVLNCKSYSPDNMPASFEKYYGRKIYPHEVFSFLILNKNFNNIPNSKLNYFPWIELNKEPILNERYIFGNASINKYLANDDKYANVYFKDDFSLPKNKDGSDRFEYYDLKIYKKDSNNSNTAIIENEYKARLFRNFILYSTNKLFAQTINNEKEMPSENRFMKVKLHSNYTDDMYVSSINNDLFDTTDSITYNNNVLEDDEVSASYTSLSNKDLLNCLNYKYFRFVLDDNLVVTVDIQKYMHDLTEYDGNYKRYYLYLSNVPEKDENSEIVSRYSSYIEYLNVNESKSKIVDFVNSVEAAKYRKGILQLIKEALNDTINSDLYLNTKSLNANNKIFSEKYSKITNSDRTYPTIEPKSKYSIVYTFNKKNEGDGSDETYSEGHYILKGNNREDADYNKYFVVKNGKLIDYSSSNESNNISELRENGYIKNELDETGSSVVKTKLGNKKYVFNIGGKTFNVTDSNDNSGYKIKDGTVAIEKTKFQELIYREAFTQGESSFVDLGLQEKYYKIGDSTKQTEFLPTIYSYISNTNSQTNMRHSVNQMAEFYRIKINDNIYAIRLDAYTALMAYEFYTGIADYNSRTKVYTYWDYFPYIGSGYLKTSFTSGSVISYTQSQEVWSELISKINGFFSREELKYSDISISGCENLSKESNSYYLTRNYFTINKLATTLEFLLSKFNTFKNTVYKYNASTKTWDDIHSDSNSENILNGRLRVRLVKKANFETNKAVNLTKSTYSNDFTQDDKGYGLEYDIRFEYIGDGKDIKLSSVDSLEIKDSGDIDTAKIKMDGIYNENNELITNIETKDLFETLFGYTKQVSGNPINYSDHINDTISIDDDNYLKISSMGKGLGSTLYFTQLVENTNQEIINSFGLVNKIKEILNPIYEQGDEYYNRGYSNKAYGARRAELFIKDSSDAFVGVPEDDKKNVVDKYEKKSQVSMNVKTGDLILTDNDINYSNLSNIYISYVLTNQTELLINKYDNFYYSSDEDINEKAKPDIVGIEGEAVYSDDNGYHIDANKSNFNIKITRNEVDTNSYYSIEEDTLKDLNIIQNDKVFVETLPINKTLEDSTVDGILHNIDTTKYSNSVVLAAAKNEVPLIFSLDDDTELCLGTADDTTGNISYSAIKDYVIGVNIGTVLDATGSYIYNSLIQQMAISNNSTFSDNYLFIVKKVFNTNNSLLFHGLTRTKDGNITFYYPDATIQNNLTSRGYAAMPNYDLSVRLLYRKLFGTNKSNPEFYALYPKDEMVKINGSGIVTYLSAGTDEYFYSPLQNLPLKFIYRNYTNDLKTQSKYGDYYINASGDGFDSNGYRFYFEKTDNANFPDIPFYLHFVNDRSYEYKRIKENYKTEQDIIEDYLKNYIITGTEINFLKPYFKTFDISARVNYNANYNLYTIKSNVENALIDKYKINNIEDIKLDNTIYRSDIFKTILDVEGVESCEVIYFGYDYTNQDEYPDRKFILANNSLGDSTSDNDFFIISVLADSTGSHGLIMEYNKVDAVAATV